MTPETATYAQARATLDRCAESLRLGEVSDVDAIAGILRQAVEAEGACRARIAAARALVAEAFPDGEPARAG